MYMRGLTPAIECEVEGRPILFTVDTGASSTDLSVRCYELFRAQDGFWKKHIVESAGAGGAVQQDVYIQPRVVMKVGTSTLTLPNVSIVPVRMNAGIDVLFGNLGLDFVELREFQSELLDDDVQCGRAAQHTMMSADWSKRRIATVRLDVMRVVLG